MGPCRTALLLMLAASPACSQPLGAQPLGAQPLSAQPPGAQSQDTQSHGAPSPGIQSQSASGADERPVTQAVAPLPAGSVKRVFVPPPVQWDNAMVNFGPALHQSGSDLAALTGGIVFGMSARQVNARLPEPYPGLSWDGLALANEYPGEVRFFGVPIDKAGELTMGLTECAGRESYVVLLFRDTGLFRMSYRFIADKTCPDTGPAALAIFARYVPITQTLAMSIHYRTGQTNVVDITDPTAGYLIPTRWHQEAN